MDYKTCRWAGTAPPCDFGGKCNEKEFDTQERSDFGDGKNMRLNEITNLTSKIYEINTTIRLNKYLPIFS